MRKVIEYRKQLKVDYLYDPKLQRHFWYVTPTCTVSMGRNRNAVTATSDYGTITFASPGTASFREDALRALYAFTAIGVISPSTLEEFASSVPTVASDIDVST